MRRSTLYRVLMLVCLSTSVTASAQYTKRMSVETDGSEGASGKDSDLCAMTSDGRFVAFASEASLDDNRPNTTSYHQIYVRDRDLDGNGTFDETSSGAVKTVMVSIDSNDDPADGQCGHGLAGDTVKLHDFAGLSISDDGRFVCFISWANNLHDPFEDAGNGFAHVYVHDRDTDENGTYDETNGYETILIDRCESDVYYRSSFFAHMSYDGAYVALLCRSHVPRCGTTPQDLSIYVFDLVNGGDELVSPMSCPMEEGFYDLGTSGAMTTTMDEAGNHYVVYGTTIRYVDASCNMQSQEYVICIYQVESGAREWVHLDANEVIRVTNASLFEDPSKGTGGLIAFSSEATNLVASDGNNADDCFIYDRATETVTRISVDSSENEVGAGGHLPYVSRNGGYAAFLSSSPDLVPNDTNTHSDTFLRDLGAGTTERVSLRTRRYAGDRRVVVVSELERLVEPMFQRCLPHRLRILFNESATADLLSDISVQSRH